MSDTFFGVEVPTQLREVSERHQIHIAELIAKLRSAGLHESSIEDAVDQLIANYRSHLIGAIKAIGASRA